MAGLLDLFGDDNARFSLGLLAAAGPRFDGANEGQRIQEALGGFDAYKQKQTQSQMQKMQMEQMQNQMARQKQMEELAKRYATPGTPGLAPIQGDAILPDYLKSGILPSAGQAAKPAGFDFQGYAQSMAAIDPMESLKLQQALQKDETPITLKEGESLLDRKTYKPIFSLPKAAAKPSAVQEYEYAREQGYPGTFQQFQLEQRKAGATNVNTRVENKMGEGLASQVGPMVKGTYDAATGAVAQIDAAKRIISAIDSGKVIAGPTAGARMKVAQIGQLLGVSGKDEAETIARSRDVIRGLSEMTLQGRKQMSGQGAITESEGKLAEKAMSGDIEDLTAAEIKQLAKASARASKFAYDTHQKNISQLQSNPSTAGLVPFYQTSPLPSRNFRAYSGKHCTGRTSILRVYFL